MCEERAAEHRHFGVGLALQCLERQGHAHGRATREVRALGERELHLIQIGAVRDQLYFGELAVPFEQWPHATIGLHLHGFEWPFGPHPLTPSPFRRGGTTGLHAASTEMSTNAIGSRSTCATSVIARPELVSPVSRTRAPYSG